MLLRLSHPSQISLIHFSKNILLITMTFMFKSLQDASKEYFASENFFSGCSTEQRVLNIAKYVPLSDLRETLWLLGAWLGLRLDSTN